MFSFITKRFRRKKSDDVPEETEQKPYQWGDAVPYSFDFSGADELRVSAIDCSRKNVESVDWVIRDKPRIGKVVELLEVLNKEGHEKLVTDRCLLRTITAYREGDPFAEVRLYDGNIQLSNTLFVNKDERFLMQQAALAEFVRVDIESGEAR